MEWYRHPPLPSQSKVTNGSHGQRNPKAATPMIQPILLSALTSCILHLLQSRLERLQAPHHIRMARLARYRWDSVSRRRQRGDPLQDFANLANLLEHDAGVPRTLLASIDLKAAEAVSGQHAANGVELRHCAITRDRRGMLLEESRATALEHDHDLIHDGCKEHVAAPAGGAPVDYLREGRDGFAHEVKGQVEHFDARFDECF